MKRSTKRSVARRRKKLPDPLVFFLDECLSYKALIEAFQAHGIRHEIHKTHFDEGVDDPTWVFPIAERNWIGLTKDKRLRYRPQVLMVREAGARLFTLAGGVYTGPQVAEIFISNMNRIEQFIMKHPKPFVAKITKSHPIEKVPWPDIPKK